MTVKELIQALSVYPPDTKVVIGVQKESVICEITHVWQDSEEEGGTGEVFIENNDS
jgi:hypothetical protein